MSLPPCISWLNLTHKPGRLFLMLSGIVFAVVLMFMFTGFKHALYDSQLEILSHLKGDVFLVSQRRPSLAIPHTFPQSILYQAKAYRGVTSVSPLYLGEAFWKNPETKLVRLTRVIAFNLKRPVFDFPELQGNLGELKLSDTTFVDRLARPELGRKEPGTVTELADRSVRVVGNFTLGNDFASLNGNLIMSETNFQRYFANRDPKEGNRSLTQVDIGVITIDSQISASTVAEILRQNLPNSIRVMTRSQLSQWERNYWETSTNIGFVFGILTIMGFVIGVILCYQIIYADIADHLKEYATLKAIGFRNRFLIGVVFQETFLLGIMGFIPGLLVSYGLYSVAKGATGLVFRMTLDRSSFLLGMTILMCFISGLASLIKVQQSDPAEVF